MAAAPEAVAGGFYISVEPAGSFVKTKVKGAVLVVRTDGCNRPSDATVVARAEGLAGGERKSLTLKLTPIEAGVYAIEREWPNKGAWVITISAHYNGATRGALVELGPNGDVATGRFPVKIVQRKISTGEVDSALASL
jgi:hypothetical protein